MSDNVKHGNRLGMTFLVHGECQCGWKMAAPEGSTWPHCPDCGEQVLPILPGEPGEDVGRLAYYLAPEQEALEKARELLAQDSGAL